MRSFFLHRIENKAKQIVLLFVLYEKKIRLIDLRLFLLSQKDKNTKQKQKKLFSRKQLKKWPLQRGRISTFSHDSANNCEVDRRNVLINL